MANHQFRRTGRTTRRIIASLKQVLDSPGTWISLMDHHDLQASHLAFAHTVSTHLKMLGVDHDLDRTKIRVHPIRKRSRV